MKNKEKKKYRILSFDGGGMRGVFISYALMKLREEYDINIIDHFDMIIGTSSGSLISSNLLLGETGKGIYEEYFGDRNIFFSKKKKIQDLIKSTFFSQYESTILEEEITKKFGKMTMEDLYLKSNEKDFAFCSSNFTMSKPLIYASKGFEKIDSVKVNSSVFEALRSSVAAPLFFDPFIDEENGDILIDGGLWANNPSMVGVNLAISKYKINIQDIEVLSFGQVYTNKKIELPTTINLVKKPYKNQLSLLFLSILSINQNQQTISAKNLLGNNIFRYSPKECHDDTGINFVSDRFIQYSKEYWEDNKEKLVEFIKRDKNL